MSEYREERPLDSEDEFRWEDRMIIKRLLQCKKLTARQHEAIRRLLAHFNYIRG